MCCVTCVCVFVCCMRCVLCLLWDMFFVCNASLPIMSYDVFLHTHAWPPLRSTPPPPPSQSHPTITPGGLWFLLLDTYQQLWALVRQYIGAALDAGPHGQLSGAVSFLLQLGFRAPGRPWALESIPAQYHSIAGIVGWGWIV